MQVELQGLHTEAGLVYYGYIPFSYKKNPSLHEHEPVGEVLKVAN